MVEQRGVEPLTSALRTRRSAKLSYCPTRSVILGSAVVECQAGADHCRAACTSKGQSQENDTTRKTIPLRSGTTNYRNGAIDRFLQPVNILPAALRHVGSAAAATVKQRTRFTHQRVHVARRVG